MLSRFFVQIQARLLGSLFFVAVLSSNVFAEVRAVAFVLTDVEVPFQGLAGELDSHFFINSYSRYWISDLQFGGSGTTWGSRREIAVQELQKLLETNDQVDIFIFAYSNSLFDLYAKMPKELTKKIRLIYNEGCSDLGQARNRNL